MAYIYRTTTVQTSGFLLANAQIFVCSYESESAHRPWSIFWQNRHRSLSLAAYLRSVKQKETSWSVYKCESHRRQQVDWSGLCLAVAVWTWAGWADQTRVLCSPSAWTLSRKNLPLPPGSGYSALAELKESSTLRSLLDTMNHTA